MGGLIESRFSVGTFGRVKERAPARAMEARRTVVHRQFHVKAVGVGMVAVVALGDKGDLEMFFRCWGESSSRLFDRPRRSRDRNHRDRKSRANSARRESF